MRVLNEHSRNILGDTGRVGALLDGLSSKNDPLWPWERWPPMRFDGPLAEGAQGGHGPIRYSVEEYEPGSRVVFRFSAPRGFDGIHWFEVTGDDGGTVLRHVIEMDVTGSASITWPLVFRPLHDALLEDSLDKAEAALRGEEWKARRLSRRVRALRSVLARRRRR